MPAAFIANLKQFATTVDPNISRKPVCRTDEVDRLAAELCKDFDKDVMNAVCLWQLTNSLLGHFAKAHNTNLDNLIALQREAICQWMMANGISEGEAQHALDRLQRSGETAHYLSTIPD